jgi:hypothetical protein
VAGPCDPSELLDIDVDELARTGALVADSTFEADPAESPDSTTVQNR